MTTKRIPQQFINEVLARTDLSELIGHRITLKKQGSRLVACCPFHNEKTPSFGISPNMQMYYCFGCKASGNAISFLMEHDGMEFMEALESLASKLGMSLPERNQTPQDSDYFAMQQLAELAATHFEQNLKKTPKAIEYLKNRGLDGQTVKHYRIGYAHAGWDDLYQHLANNSQQQHHLVKAGLLIQKDTGGCYDRFRDRIIFPIRNVRGQVIAFGGRVLDAGEPKYLNSPESPLFQKRSELYGLYEARHANRKLERVLVVEGYMDVVALAQHGIHYAVATLGTAATIRHVHSLLRYTSEIIFCFDGDKAGQQAAWHALEIILPILRDDITIRFMLLPEGDDPDSLVRQLGAETFDQQIQSAMSFSEFFFQKLRTDHDIDSIEGKAQFGRHAMELLNNMPKGILQGIMIEQLGEVVHMSEERLRTLVQKSDKPPAHRPKPSDDFEAPRVQPAKMTGLMQRLLSLILQHPQLVQDITLPDILSNLQGEGGKLLSDIIEIIKEHPNINSAALFTYWQNKPEAQLLRELASKEHLIAPELWANEVNDIIKRLAVQSNEQESAHLMKLARRGELDEAGKKRLMALLKE